MKFKSLIYTGLLACAVNITACETFVEGVEEVDPTAPIDASAELTLTGAQVAYIGVQEGEIARLAGLWAGYFTGIDRQYVNYEEYNVTAADFDGAWGNVYSGVIQQVRIVQDKAEEAGNTSMLGVAQIMDAHMLGLAASLWGDVPNEEAANVEEFANPTYKDQLAVYGDAQELLSAGIANLERGVGDISGDVLYNNNSALWIEAAHTLKAKFYLHTGDYPEAIAEAQLGISSPENSMYAEHGSSWLQNFNIYYSFLVYDRPGYMGANEAYAPEILNPESPQYRGNEKTAEGARFRWFYHTEGFYAAPPEPNYLSLEDRWGGIGFFGTTTPFPLITWQENQLIIAEVAARLDQFGTGLVALNAHRDYLNSGEWEPEDAYNRTYGYNEEILYEEYNEADFAAGGIENEDGLAQNRALLREVLEERYVTFVGQIEGFNDVRRTQDEEDVRVEVEPKTGDQLPQRFLYPQDEINSNTSTPDPIPGFFVPTDVNE
jgi:hypothetical protein